MNGGSDLRAIAERVRWDISRYGLSEYELKLLEIIVRQSLLRGKTECRFPRALFTAWTGIRGDKVLETLRKLARARIIVKDIWLDDVFQIAPDADGWKAKEMATREAALEADRSLGCAADPDRRDDLAPDSGAALNSDFAARRVKAAAAAGQKQEKGLDGVLPSGRECADRAGEVPADRAALVNCQQARALPDSGCSSSDGAPSPDSFAKCAEGAGELPVLAEPSLNQGERSLNQGKTSPASLIQGEKPGFPESGRNVVQRLNVLNSPENVITLKRFQSLNQGKIPGHRQEELIGRTRAAVGEMDWGNYGGAWVTHGVRKDPDALDRALNDFELTVREGQIEVRNRGAYLWKLFKMFGGGRQA